MRALPFGGAALAASLVIGGASAGTLDNVKQNGFLKCGTHTGLAGFAQPDDKGVWKGFDVDYCRAVAAAIFNDPNKVKFIPLSAKDRFTALQSGDADMLARNSTWTMARDTSLGFNFVGVSYYDGQGFMVHRKLAVKSAKELNGATICTEQGTTTELNLADFFRANNQKYELVTFAGSEETIKAYESGRCDAYTTDASAIYGQRLRLAKPDEHVVMPELISKEPLGPVVRHGDDQWFDIVKWTHFALVNAEELGITQANVDRMKESDNPEVKRLLGTEGKFGESIGLTNDWVVRIVKAVGNYGEVFENNFGEKTPLKVKRGANELWNKGGLQYAPPVR
ncbi:amino acid ABC transporter substrate-binding protein [Chelatococcus sp. SYSU_G07232]|uniref:Amino acid ABC transporter substrate-binding protein n=1 Tax=Chelatococcus albus TaxID=3047466 RepID=A0ABT7AMG7_9HYPH|nr:amino acid ABC transporter substrate-binding protein [Chelatococcus sp. SYSU_G07232]MDJ1159999.1 amino acid ABC transporter substrate-binding protein [Chelatococcus sp. SYSU_G07232]